MKKTLFELTNPQKSIWLTEQYYKGTTANNLCGTVNINEKIDFKVLENALNLVIKNNSNFLINFKQKNGELFQYLTDYKYFNIETINVKSSDDVKAIENSLNNKVFNIENSYLFEFKIFKFPNSTGGFVFCCHHLLGDSWSLGLICKEAIRAYNSLCQGTENELPTSNYIDFCKTEKNYLQSLKFQKDKEYWDLVFSTIPEVASIPSKNKNTYENISCKANRNTYEISKDIMEKINEFCKSNKISVFNFITSIYSLYISRTCNLKDFVIGTPILNRSNFAEKNTLGMFVSTAALRVNLENKNTFLDLASNIAQNSMSMLRHQKYPYEYILKDLRQRIPNLPNLYNILISYQITKTTTDTIKHTTNWAFNGNCADELQIHILDLNDTGNLNISYDYKTQKYTSNEIEDIHKRIIHIINQILNNNSILLNDIEIVTEEEKKELLYDFNNTKFEYDKTKTIAELFEEQVRKTPNNVAIVFEGKQLTYKELNEKANQLANYLRKNNIKNNTIVGIVINRSLEMMVSILAVLKSGGAYIPIDPDYPDERISYMLEDSKTAIILTTKETNKNFNITTIYVNLDNLNIYSGNENNLKKISNPTDLSYLIYTSGSTGKPKGVMLTQQSFLNLYYGVAEKVKYLNDGLYHSIVSITTISFDIFAFESIISLTKGLKVFITNAMEQKITSKLEELISKNNIEIIQTTPSIMNFHINSLLNKNSFNSLKYIVLAGEQLPKSLVDKIKNTIDDITIYNGYGPSETTIFSTITDVTNADSITIGKPIANTKIYILDETKNLLPKYCIGELYIAGDGVGKGYLFKEDLTSQKFIKNKFLNNSIMYEVGDLGFWNDNGTVECKGRIDHQIKLRGLRIELGEIEECIESFSKNNSIECAVIVKKVDDKEKLIAFINSNKEINLPNLKKSLVNKLPNYMIPNEFVFLNSLPHTPNGKIDRKTLQTINIDLKQKNIVLPTTNTEKEIVKIISAISKNKEISIEDDFYSIGLDSLDIIKLSSVIIKQFNVEIPVSKLYSLSNIRQIADYVDNNSNNLKQAIKKALDSKYYPLSNAQKRIYYASKMSTNSLVYNISGGLLVDSLLNENKVSKIFNTIIQKHSAFRTCFKIIEDEPKQVVLKDAKINIKSFNTKNQNVEELINNFPKQFDFENAPLLRVELYYINNKQTLLLIDSHHIILDGSSLNILINEFCKLYNNEAVEEEKVDYKDFTIWENEFVNSKEIKKLEENWLNIFKNVDIPVINLPYDYPVSQVKTFNGNTIKSKIPQSTFKKLEILAKNNHVSPYVLFLSAFYAMLYRYTGQETIIVGSPISGRFDSSLENTIGMFVNNIPLAININSESSFIEFMNVIKDKVITALDNGSYPYDMLTKALNLKSNTNLFDVMFTYQSENNELPKIENKDIDIIYANTKTAKYNISLEIIPNTNTINLEYNTDLFKEETAKEFLKHYLVVLENIITNSEAKLYNLNLLTNEEKNKILYEFNDTKLEYPTNKTVSMLFEEKAKQIPNKTALVFKNKSLTFKQLDEKSNELANYLRSINIEKNDIVGIMLERSLELIISILASLKCGCCYIPIDPNFPNERINYMLKNSNSKILLTSEKTYNKTSFNNKLVVNLDNLNVYNGNSTKLENINTPNDNSYIIYTSGSTGTPKGVVLKHKSLTNLAYYLNENLGFFKEKENTIVSITTASFDIFLFETIMCLQAGVKVVVATEDEQRIPSKLNSLIQNNNATAIQMTPSRMQFFIENIGDMPNLKDLKYVTLAGEPLSKDLLKELLKIGIKKVYNGYGPSETTVFSTFTDVTNQDIVTIGKPLANTQIYILDKNMSPCPIGVPGELYIAGDGVGNGYLNNIELTQKSFIPNPFIPNSTMYKVGDLCKWLKNGEILCLGRVDNQIKIRGLRIELEEIENRILSFPFIKKCVVVKKTMNTREFICAYYIADKRIKVSDLRAHLAKNLPDYMIPSYFTALSDFPYTPNGKIDKKSLPMPELGKNKTNNFVAPKTDLEIKLANIFENILSTSPIGVTDNFFELGGDSILAMRLNIELLKISSKITYADIFENPTISGLITLIESTKNIETHLNNIDNSKYEKLLNKNVEFPKVIKKTPCKNLLLTGATGFLGIHVLDSFLRNDLGNVFCIVRDEPGISAETKLLNKLNYYFGEKYNNLINKKIFIINGDISKDNLGLSQRMYYNLGITINAVINCAAKVDHFGKYETFYNINVKGVQNLIDFCNIYKKKFYQVSTLSVSGNSFVDDYATEQSFTEDKEFRENNFYINQTINNVYIKTKFEAENLVLDNILNGLDGYILRVRKFNAKI